MGKEAEDKAERILSMYTRLKQGKVIEKEQESQKHHVSCRTIQRDIADIQCFLQNQSINNADIQEVVYDKQQGGYILQTKSNNQLNSKEILATAKLGENILTEEKAIEIAKYKCNIEYDQIKADFSYENETWTVSFFKGYNQEGDAIVGGDLQVVMDASGNIMDLIYGE